ncbi:hypothetical protein JCM10213_003727 [Rhodosporidiobolus nylandii]
MSASSVARPVTALLRQSSAAPLQAVAGPSRLVGRSGLSAHSRLAPAGGAPPCVCGGTGKRNYSSYPTEKLAPAPFAPTPRKKRTILDLQNLKKKRVPITMLTAHDYPSARFIEAASLPTPPSPSSSSPTSATSALDHPSPDAAAHPRGIDICLVGDSLAMVACGYSNTNQLPLEELLYHCRSVARGCTTSLLISDLPFGTYAASVEDGVRAAVRLVQEGRMDGVKIEGGQEIVPLVERLTSNGIPVMAHVGLTPQRSAALSGFRVQGKDLRSAAKVYEDAKALQDAGAFAVLIEAVPSRLGAWITEQLSVPTIGIGAGGAMSGQVLVQLDMLGVDSQLGASGKGPKFLKKFGDVGERAKAAVREYVREVRDGSFPEEGRHTYEMSDEAWEGFLRWAEESGGTK